MILPCRQIDLGLVGLLWLPFLVGIGNTYLAIFSKNNNNEKINYFEIRFEELRNTF
jgi:hypothetical protein